MADTTVARRHFLGVCSALGLTSTLFPGVLWGLAQQEPAKPPAPAEQKPEVAPAAKQEAAPAVKITRAMIEDAAAIAGVSIPDKYKDMMLEGLNDQTGSFEEIRKLKLENGDLPALVFDPLPAGTVVQTAKQPPRLSRIAAPGTPKNIEDVAFQSVRELGTMMRARRISSTALTEMYLERLKRYDPLLKFVITLTTERALAQAKEADRDLAAGRYRGPLHGLPWGAKDLIAAKGYRTTWGAGGFEEQTFPDDATVVKRLDEAGAVLVAKLTLGALAMGDKWFGGFTRNPWRPQDQGSSGSSAGSASATAAGCVAFAIGSETLGSISSPSTRCGVTGLRPTFGLVPRTGAMALSPTWDKLGPLARSVEDAILVLSAIAGPDGADPDCRHHAAVNWDADFDWRKLRVGYFAKAFQPRPQPTEPPASKPEAQLSAEEKKKADEELVNRRERRAYAAYDRKFDLATLDKLRQMGIKLIEVTLPEFPYGAAPNALVAEAAAMFDELTRSGRDRLLTEQGPDDWPNTFRVARFLPAVEYIQINRARLRLMAAFQKLFEQVDVIVTPTADAQLIATNLTGNPAVIVPNGFRGLDAPPLHDYYNGGGPDTPVSITFLGPLFGEAKLCALAKAYQDATGFHLRHPKLG